MWNGLSPHQLSGAGHSLEGVKTFSLTAERQTLGVEDGQPENCSLSSAGNSVASFAEGVGEASLHQSSLYSKQTEQSAWTGLSRVHSHADSDVLGQVWESKSISFYISWNVQLWSHVNRAYAAKWAIFQWRCVERGWDSTACPVSCFVFPGEVQLCSWS